MDDLGVPPFMETSRYTMFFDLWRGGLVSCWRGMREHILGGEKIGPMSVKGAEVARFRDSSQPGVFCTWHVKKISSAVWARFETRNNRSITTRKGHGWGLGASKQTSSKHLQFVHRCFCKGIDLPSCFRGGCDGEGQQTRSPFKF